MMERKGILRSLIVITSLLLSLNLQAQSLIHVEPAGSLRTLLGESANQITDLTLTGTLNGTDLKVIREMANLSILNLADANIVTGGDSYYHNGDSEHENAIGWFDYHSSKDELGQYTFYNLNKLTSVIVPNSITKIDNFAFYLCPNLTSVTVGNSVTSIAEFVFASSPRLKTITIPDNVTSIGGYAFFACTDLISVDLGNGTASIGTKCFQNCTGLISVKIGNRTASIGEGAFQNCRRLANIYARNPAPPGIGMNCFLYLPATCKLHVPEGSVDAYRSAAGWGDFISIDATAITPISLNRVFIHPTANGISIETAETVSVSIYTISGQKVYQSQVNGHTEIRLPKGIYIVNANNESKKIIR
jgi:hypothetical protein